MIVGHLLEQQAGKAIIVVSILLQLPSKLLSPSQYHLKI